MHFQLTDFIPFFYALLALGFALVFVIIDIMRDEKEFFTHKRIVRNRLKLHSAMRQQGLI